MEKLIKKGGVVSLYYIFLLIIMIFFPLISFENIGNEFYALAITVNDDGGADYTKIQDAIDNATNGSIIYVQEGIYYENVIINITVTIIGAGQKNTTIDGGNNDNVVEITVNWVNISGFKMINSRISANPLKYGAGVKLNQVENVTVKNNNCSNNMFGIWLYNSNFSRITNNSCSNNSYAGIRLYHSNYNNLINNTCINSSYGFEFWWHSNFNKIKNNICNYNDNYGMTLEQASNSIIINNTCNFNNYNGIDLVYCDLCVIKNNICSNNQKNGFHFWPINGSVFTNNNGYNNIENGILLENWCTSVIIENNSFQKNENGIQINNYCKLNTIQNNSCSNNTNQGIVIKQSSNSNTISDNIISNNTNNGFSIDPNCANNYLYYNHILFNKNQASDSGNNFWNNSDQEGNYWSDYSGLDIGYMTYGWDITNKHQIAGDGIGDTLVPHLGLDYYPFTNRLGWLKPGTPILKDPGDIDSDGNYNLSWNRTIRTNGYILEEDNSSSFDSPTEIYNDTSLIFNISRKTNGTYYYRVKAYNEKYESPWSNIVDIIVDWLPDIPKNLSISTYPPGNTLNLTWDLNLIDTNQYIIEYKNETITNWQQIDPILHPGFTFNHTGLVDGEKYYYRIQAQDHRDQVSNFSENISGIPWDSVPPAPPTGLSVITTTNDSISLEWNPNTEDDLEGYHLFRSEITNPSEWGESIGTIPKGTEEFIDTGLIENTTYYYVLTAFDEVPNNSSYSNIAFGTTIMGQHKPEINISQDDFSIPEDTIDDSTINLYYWFKDINNDLLIFKCEGQNNLSVTIFQENGTVILIPKKDWNGKETLTFYANDSFQEISDDVTIRVTPVNDPPGPAVIITPEEGIKIKNRTKINFSGICNDVDLIYGDILTFNWTSNISGRIGNGKNLTDIILQPGQHQILLEASDIAGEKSMAIVNITIFENITQGHKPKFDIKLELVPNIVKLKPGEQISVKAIVTNLGEVDDRVVLNISEQDIEGIEVNINEPKIKDIILNRTAEFDITIKALDNAKKGEILINVVAVSLKAAEYEIIEEEKATLTVQILEKEDQGEDKLSTDYWIIILIIIVIIIILIIIGLLIRRKKQPPPEEEPIKESPPEEPTTLEPVTTFTKEPATEEQEYVTEESISEELQEQLAVPQITETMESEQIVEGPEPEQIETMPEQPQLPSAQPELTEPEITIEKSLEDVIETSSLTPEMASTSEPIPKENQPEPEKITDELKESDESSDYSTTTNQE